MEDIDIYNRISIINVKNKLGLKEKYAKGDIIYVRCPFCTESNVGNLKLNVVKDSYYCRRCGEKGLAIGLYARCNLITNKEAYIKLISEEADMTTSLVSIRKAIKRSQEDISFVYETFLKLLGLTKYHYNILLKLGFSRDEIIKYGFKSIPQKEYTKIAICNKLIENGISLLGIPGFFMNKQMKWTFKSHKGFFIPVMYHNRINGLRIHLDKKYKLETTDIWFSSSKEFQGANAENWIQILMPEEERKSQLLDRNLFKEKEVVLASEFLLAYRLFKKLNKITIAVPNTISKKQAIYLLKEFNIKKIDVFLDKHTIYTDPVPIYNNLLDRIDDSRKNIKMIIADNDISNSYIDMQKSA